MIHGATVQVIDGDRITLPSEIRRIENIKKGDYVKITIEKIFSVAELKQDKAERRKNI